MFVFIYLAKNYFYIKMVTVEFAQDFFSGSFNGIIIVGFNNYLTLEKNFVKKIDDQKKMSQIWFSC